MFRRAVLIAIAAAAALIFAPSAAMAVDYTAVGYSASVSDTSPAIGQAFNVFLSGARSGQRIRLSVTADPASARSSIVIDGVTASSFTSTADANGKVTFAVTLGAAGTYTLTMTDASTGALISTQTVTVAAGSSANSSVVVGTGGQLSGTGYGGTGLAVGGVLLVLAGAGGVTIARRRKTTAKQSA